MTSEDPVALRLKATMKRFLISAVKGRIFVDFDSIVASVKAEFQPALRAFRHSVEATVSTVELPLSLASASSQRIHFQRIHTAEWLRARARAIEQGKDVDDEETIELTQNEALSLAGTRMGEFAQSEEGRNALALDTCDFLLRSLEDGLGDAADELLQQGLVLLWSAFEVLYRDTFETLLNIDPSRIMALMNEPATRKRFEAERLPLDTIAEFGFDLSGHIGTVLVSKQDFSDLPTVKAVYAVLYPQSTELRDALAHRDLWTLYQQRHLVVHRRGVIDQAYRQATGDTAEVGTRLAVTPSAFNGHLKVVGLAANALARCLCG